MSLPKLEAAVLRETWDAFVAAGHNQVTTAKALGIARSTLQHRLKQAVQLAKAGMLGTDAVIPGFEITRISEGPRGKTIEQKQAKGEVFEMPATLGIGKMTIALGADGRVERQWLRAMPGAVDYDAFAVRMEEKYSAIDFRLPEIPAPTIASDEHLNFFGLGDLHFGLRIAGREVGDKDWNVAKAAKVYREAFSNLMAVTPPAKRCVLMVGGDVTHQNDATNRTPKSHHVLDVDGTYTDAIEAAQEFILDATMMAAQVHREVEVAFIHGNHDEESIVAVASFIRGVFRDHPASVSPRRASVSGSVATASR